MRLSPAGDGAEDAEETCEKQKRSTWWMDVLVGGSGQGLFTWETRSSRSVTSSWTAKTACSRRRQEPSRPCRQLRRPTSAAQRHGDRNAPTRRQMRPRDGQRKPFYRRPTAPALTALERQLAGHARDHAPAAACSAAGPCHCK